MEAAALLGAEVARARRERSMTTTQLAERAGITRVTLRKVEHGDPTVALGTAFEVAFLVGVQLFGASPAELAARTAQASRHLELLPQRIRSSDQDVDDDF
jgi:DNA-binding XRE family transcriptional regulator